MLKPSLIIWECKWRIMLRLCKWVHDLRVKTIEKVSKGMDWLCIWVKRDKAFSGEEASFMAKVHVLMEPLLMM